jgi:hypothetical protein
MTMKTTIASLLMLAGLLAVTPQATAQTAQCTTTLASAITSTSNTGVSLTSASCLSSVGPQSLNQYLFVDNELLYVRQQATSPTTFISTTRGASGTHAALHASGATVYIGPGTAFSQSTTSHSGGCVQANLLYAPLVVVSSIIADGGIFNCYGGSATAPAQWVKIGSGTNSPAGQFVNRFCTGTVGSAETEYLNGAACSGATTATAQYVVPSAGTVATLSVYSTAVAVGGTNKDVLTVYKNGSSTTLTCTIAASAQVCTDSAHSFSVAAGDRLTFQFITATSDTAANVTATVGLY